ncbi:hypothetical protein [Vallitalea guaymasensis]|uniref:hypothetical protein n=1 Tax=Vallitalea guaymasensis TaxID=1185412 RepID=UPI000DE210E6|nr:hypothetical protein [Vallitalea guaymasensis]
MIYTEMSIKELVDEFTIQHKAQKEAENELERIKTELQQRGLKYLEDKNLKTVQYWGNHNNYVLVQKTEALDMLDYTNVKAILKNQTQNCVKPSVDYKYKFEKDFKLGMAAIFEKNYETRSVEDILREMQFNSTQIDTIKNKLTLSWVKDKELLKLHKCEVDIELYLYFIHEAMKYEKLVTILKAAGYEDNIYRIANDLKKSIMKKDGIKVTCSYEKG